MFGTVIDWRALYQSALEKCRSAGPTYVLLDDGDWDRVVTDFGALPDALQGRQES